MKSLRILQTELGEFIFSGRWTCGRFDKTIARTWWISLVLTGSLSMSSHAANELVRGEISRIGDATHLEFRGLTQWPYELKSAGKGIFTLQIPALDPATQAAISTWSDSLVAKVDIKQSGPDGSYIITFQTSDPKVESFDYLTDEPSRLIIDFYKQADEPKTKTAETVAPSQSTSLPAKKVAKSRTKEKSKTASNEEGYQQRLPAAARSPAGDERLSVDAANGNTSPGPMSLGGLAFDASDPLFKRLTVKDYSINEEAVIASQKNLYLQFPLLKMPVSLMSELQGNLPEFIINPKDTAENKEARLLLNLYNRQVAKTERTKDRIGAFLKVFDHFTKTFPQSEYDEIVKNLAAHIYYQRWLSNKDTVDFENSMAFYKYLVSKYPTSPLTERNQQMLVFGQLDRGDGLATLQEIEEHDRRYPKSAIRDQIALAKAEAFLLLNKYQDALQTYQGLATQAETPQKKIEAEFRMGDVAFEAKNYSVAESAYQQAIKKFPAFANTFPNAYFNMAESQFWQRKFQPSLESHIKFLSTFPNDEYGGYSMTRAGELMDAMGVDRSRVMGAFLESYFRYRNNPGAEVARIRLLSQQMRGMKEKELIKAIEEMNQIAEHSPLPQIGEFSVIMRVDGLQRRGENQAALRDLISFYQGHPSSTNLDLFRSRILRNIAETMDHQLTGGQFMDALQTKSKYDRTWLKDSDRLDISFFQGRAFELAGVTGEAKRIYERTLMARKKLVGTSEEKIRAVNEILPGLETLRLRLAAVAIVDREYPEAYRQLQDLGEPKQLSSAERLERVDLYAKVYEERGQLDQAQNYLKTFISNWRGDPERLASTHIHLARLYLKGQQPGEAEKAADQVLAMHQQKTPVSTEDYALALELKGQALEGQSKDLAATEAYQQLLDEMEDQLPLGGIRYRLGQLVFKRGDLGGAEKIWAKLDSTKYGTFRKLAFEQLENAQWQSEHRRYVNRIPAMAKSKEK